MNTKKIILSGVIIWILGSIYTWLTCGWLFNWVYTLEPIIWKAPEAMIAPTVMIVSALLGLLIAIIFASVYAFIHKGLPYKGAKRGLVYGFIVWLVGAFSGLISLPFYMTINKTVVIYWIISALVTNLFFGAIVGAIYVEKAKPKKKKRKR